MTPPNLRTTLYLVRHGETEPNRLGIVQGRGLDAPLNAVGRTQAERLAAFLSDVPFRAAYTSTLRRAGETAEIVLNGRNGSVPLQRLDGLDEMNWGVYEGQAFRPPVSDEIAGIKAAWERGRYDVGPAGGESVQEVRDRTVAALQRVVDAHPGENVLVVAHGRMMRILLASVLTEFGLPRMEEIASDNTGLNILHAAEGAIHAEVLNSVIHLHGMSPDCSR